MVNFLGQDIYLDRENLEYIPSQESYKSCLVPFANCLAEPVPEDTLATSTIFQIVDVRNTSVSVMSVIELLIDALDVNEGFQDHYRNTRRRPHRIAVNAIDLDAEHARQSDQREDESDFTPGYKDTYRLTLQDCFGNLCYAYEAEPLSFLRNTRNKGLFRVTMGSKLLINAGAKISFNTLHLKNSDVNFLRGQIQRMNVSLYQRKLKELKEEIGYEG
jgi:hypothetical protein